MNRKLWRGCQFAFAFIYACLLIAGAVPRPLLPQSWGPYYDRFKTFEFERLRILSGLGVFNFSTGMDPFQPVSSCLEVEVKTRLGRVQVFKDFQCPWQKGPYSIYQPANRIFYSNLSTMGEFGSTPKARDTMLLMATAEYFCRQYEGQTAIIRFSTQYQNVVNRVLMSWPSLPHVMDCAILRSRNAAS